MRAGRFSLYCSWCWRRAGRPAHQGESLAIVFHLHARTHEPAGRPASQVRALYNHFGCTMARTRSRTTDKRHARAAHSCETPCVCVRVRAGACGRVPCVRRRRAGSKRPRRPAQECAQTCGRAALAQHWAVSQAAGNGQDGASLAWAGAARPGPGPGYIDSRTRWPLNIKRSARRHAPLASLLAGRTLGSSASRPQTGAQVISHSRARSSAKRAAHISSGSAAYLVRQRAAGSGRRPAAGGQQPVGSGQPAAGPPPPS